MMLKIGWYYSRRFRALGSVEIQIKTALLLIAAAGLTWGQPSVAHDISNNYVFVKLDYKGAAVSFPLGINIHRDIVGVRVDAMGVNHGYFYSKGKFTDIEYPGASAVPGGGTFTGGLNDRGDIGGVYTDAKGFQHGFIRTYPEDCEREDEKRCQPAFHAIDVPGAVQTAGIVFELGTGLGTAVIGLNNRQDVVGLYAKGIYSVGFELSRGQYRVIDDPASSHSAGNGSCVFGINDLGFSAGSDQTQADAASLSISHGFVYTGFNYIPVYVPGSEKGGFGTQANGINIFLQVVGVYTDPTGMFHGMLWAGRCFV